MNFNEVQFEFAAGTKQTCAEKSTRKSQRPTR